MSEIKAPPRTVGFWGSTLLPINGMIGAGIFAMPAILVAAVGNFAPWMMLIGGVLLIPLAFVFVMLSREFEGSGGPVLYADVAFGSFAGFQSGWMRYASSVAAVAANTHVAIAYAAVLLPVLNDPLWNSVAVIGFILFTTLVNLFGMKSSVRTLAVMTAVKLLPLVGLVFAGLFAGNPAIGVTLPEFSAFESVVLLTFYAFMSFENLTYAAGEVKDARKTVPRSLIAVLSVVTLFYMLVIWAYLAIAPQTSGEGSALAIAAGEVAGDIGVVVISLAAAFSIAANTFGGGIIIPRMTFGMAERGLLPAIFARVSPRFQTPDVSILFYGGVAILFGLWGGFAALAVASTLSRIVTYVLSAAALPVLQRRNEGRSRAFHGMMALLAIGSALYVAAQAKAESWQMLGVIFVAGTVLYFFARRRPLRTMAEA